MTSVTTAPPRPARWCHALTLWRNTTEGWLALIRLMWLHSCTVQDPNVYTEAILESLCVYSWPLALQCWGALPEGLRVSGSASRTPKGILNGCLQCYRVPQEKLQPRSRSRFFFFFYCVPVPHSKRGQIRHGSLVNKTRLFEATLSPARHCASHWQGIFSTERHHSVRSMPRLTHDSGCFIFSYDLLSCNTGGGGMSASLVCAFVQYIYLIVFTERLVTDTIPGLVHTGNTHTAGKYFSILCLLHWYIWYFPWYIF